MPRVRVRVAVRLRPLLQHETDAGAETCVGEVSDNALQLVNMRLKDSSLRFTYVGSAPDDSQSLALALFSSSLLHTLFDNVSTPTSL